MRDTCRNYRYRGARNGHRKGGYVAPPIGVARRGAAASRFARIVHMSRYLKFSPARSRARSRAPLHNAEGTCNINRTRRRKTTPISIPVCKP